MFRMFPFNFNNNGNQTNNNSLLDLGLFNNLFNEDAISNLIDEIMSSDLINDFTSGILDEDSYDIEFKDFGDYYLIKGYLPGLTARM